MKIYRPHSDAGFEWVQVDHEDRKRLLALPEEPVIDQWTPPRATRLLEDEGEQFREADLPWLGGHWLVLRSRAREVLAPAFGDAVELLPLNCEGGPALWVTHALVKAPVLDLERSAIKRFRSGGIMQIVRHEFLPAVSEVGPAFHLEAMHRGALYLTDEVVRAAQAAGLTGARYEEVWSDAQ